MHRHEFNYILVEIRSRLNLLIPGNYKIYSNYDTGKLKIKFSSGLPLVDTFIKEEIGSKRLPCSIYKKDEMLKIIYQDIFAIENWILSIKNVLIQYLANHINKRFPDNKSLSRSILTFYYLDIINSIMENRKKLEIDHMMYDAPEETYEDIDEEGFMYDDCACEDLNDSGFDYMHDWSSWNNQPPKKSYNDLNYSEREGKDMFLCEEDTTLLNLACENRNRFNAKIIKENELKNTIKIKQREGLNVFRKQINELNRKYDTKSI